MTFFHLKGSMNYNFLMHEFCLKEVNLHEPQIAYRFVPVHASSHSTPKITFHLNINMKYLCSENKLIQAMKLKCKNSASNMSH